MTDLDALLGAARLVDLTQPLGPDTTLWPGSAPFAAAVVADYDSDGCYLGDGAVAFPGLACDAAELLVARRAAGIGIDTLSVDPGSSTDHPVHRTVLPAGIWQLEGLVGLEQLPARGAWLVAAPLLLIDGSGAPARVFAILPADG